MFLKKIFNFLSKSNKNESFIHSSVNNNIIKANFVGELNLNGNQQKIKTVDITNQPSSSKEIEVKHFSKLSLSHFKFVFIQNESLNQTKIKIEAPENFIDYIFISHDSIGFKDVNVIGSSKDLNVYISIEGKAPEKLELSCSATFTTLAIKNENFSLKADTSSLFNSLELLSNYLKIDCSTHATVDIKHLKPMTGILTNKIDCSTSATLDINYLYNSASKVDLSTSGKITIKHLINSKIKGECSTSALLLTNNLNVVDVETSTSGKVKKV